MGNKNGIVSESHFTGIGMDLDFWLNSTIPQFPLLHWRLKDDDADGEFMWHVVFLSFLIFFSGTEYLCGRIYMKVNVHEGSSSWNLDLDWLDSMQSWGVSEWKWGESWAWWPRWMDSRGGGRHTYSILCGFYFYFIPFYSVLFENLSPSCLRLLLWCLMLEKAAWFCWWDVGLM